MTSLKNFYPLTRRTMLGVMGGAMVLAAWPFALHARPPKRVLKCRARRALEQPAVVADPAAQTDTGLTPEQAETVRRLVEVMIPSDTTPGAADTGSADFVLASLPARMKRRGKLSLKRFPRWMPWRCRHTDSRSVFCRRIRPNRSHPSYPVIPSWPSSGTRCAAWRSCISTLSPRVTSRSDCRVRRSIAADIPAASRTTGRSSVPWPSEARG
jgi:hypothetical protein